MKLSREHKLTLLEVKRMALKNGVPHSKDLKEGRPGGGWV